MGSRLVVCVALLVGCREQNTEPPTGHEIKPPRSAARLAPEAGLSAPQAALMNEMARDVMSRTSTGPGITQKLFTDDVAADVLPLSMSIETLGDVATPIIPRGTRLPATHTELFSTAQDDQSSVVVHVVQGERPLASLNRSLGKFQLFGIPPAPRGVPQIEVTFAIDRQGVLTVSARDRATGQHRQIRIDGGASGPLDQTAIDRLLAEAKEAKADDDMRREWSQVRNELESLIYTSRNLVAAAGPKMKQKTRTRTEREIAAAEAVLRLSTKPENPALLRGVLESLRTAIHRASEELYSAAK